MWCQTNSVITGNYQPVKFGLKKNVTKKVNSLTRMFEEGFQKTMPMNDVMKDKHDVVDRNDVLIVVKF